MKENYKAEDTPLNELTDRYVNGNINYDEFEKEVKALYSCKKEDMEEKKIQHYDCFFDRKPILKEFDLEAAKAGKPVCTRGGRKVRIICFDAKGDKPIIALVEAKGNKDALIEEVERYFINGHSVFEVRETNNDLMMLPEKHDGWVNVYYNRTDGITFSKHPYPSKEEAIKNAGTMSNIIDTVNISWYE